MNEIKNNKMENSYLGRSWYFVTFSVADYPPPWKIQISNFFPKTKSEVAEYPPPPTHPPKNCQKSWHFDFSVAEYPPHPPTKKLSEILAL